MEKFNRSYIRYMRYTVQWGILIFLIFAGYQLYLFVEYFNSPGLTIDNTDILSKRYPSIEGFLPIGALMSLKLWITTGILDRIHPAGLVIFIAAILTSLILRKSFCGWICPVGAISETVSKLGEKIFKRNIIMNKYIDHPLRAIKYLLLSFFIYVIAIKMDSGDILKFLSEDYYKIADVKMLYFFTKMTSMTFITLLILFIGSLFFRNFWCRYLCPYGALVGTVSLFSPVKITRNTDACINCGKCSKNCLSFLPVDKKVRISSPECTGCLVCVSYCPAKGALDIAMAKNKILNPILFSILVLILFFGAISIGKTTSKWNSAVTHEEYSKIIPQADILKHP
ncbi:MAG: 4Fe-4S binding protein [Nitrospiraceae bacterium]|nr:4Fe-4S binding protein [Nitrospiraceae bacterium]